MYTPWDRRRGETLTPPACPVLCLPQPVRWQRPVSSRGLFSVTIRGISRGTVNRSPWGSAPAGPPPSARLSPAFLVTPACPSALPAAALPPAERSAGPAGGRAGGQTPLSSSALRSPVEICPQGGGCCRPVTAGSWVPWVLWLLHRNASCDPFPKEAWPWRELVSPL